jgi:ligand-binding sensor domain-containing protein
VIYSGSIQRNYQIKTISFGKRGEYAHEFYEDSDGKIWIGAENGLYSYRNGNIEKESRIDDQLEDKTIYSILRDREGKLWIGTFGKGIFIFDDNDNLIANIVRDKGFISNAINHLYMDSKGGYMGCYTEWIGLF